jgi:hypothetical protein
MKIRFTKAPTFTKGIIAAAIFGIIYLATTSNLPSCSDAVAALNSGGECIERQSFLHTASGWLALICVILAVLLLALKHKDSILGRGAPAQEAHHPAQQANQGPQAPAQQAFQVPRAPAQQAFQVPRAPAPTPGRASGFCTKCGTRIIAGDRFCQGCGIPMGAKQS